MNDTHLTGCSVIGGAPGGTGGRTFRAVDPARGVQLAPDFHEASGEEAAHTMDLAAAAFREYRRCSAGQRAQFLETIATQIESLGDALVQRAMSETGLPPARLAGERGRTCAQLRLFAQVVREGSWVDARIDTALPAREPLPRPDLRRMLRPLGPVVVFGSSNFPLAFSTAGGDTASALAAGCTVVVKAHRAHPGTGELVAGAIARAAVQCALPSGVFSMLHGDGATLGRALVQHPAAAAVGFTGSHTAGRALFDAAAARARPIPVFAEMSSINPVFLLPNALRGRGQDIARALAASVTLGVGQFCTKPGLVFVLRDAASEDFIAALAAAMAQVGPGTMLTAGIREAFESSRDAVLAHAGVERVVAATASASTGRTPDAQGMPAFLARTSAKHLLQSPQLTHEAFGPFTLVVVADDLPQMLACARHLEGQLTATVHGDAADLAAAGELLEIAEQFAGRVIVGGYPTGVEVAAAMNHGGPYPATTDVRFTSVGTAAMLRFARPVCFQGFDDALLPEELRNANPLGLLRLVDGERTRRAI